MKLWQIVQWGNVDEPGDGLDTQCIISAVDLKSAVERGKFHLQYEVPKPYKDGVLDAAFLMGDDGRPDGEPKLVVRVWYDHALNFMDYPSWYRHPDTDEWLDRLTMYGE